MKKIVLHSCCGPCLSSAAFRLKDKFFAACWYNPNIEPEPEHDLRRITYRKLLEHLGLEEKESDYDYKQENKLWHSFIEGLENEPEGGERCKKCIEFRLKKVSKLLDKNESMMTSLTVSPHKNSRMINEIGAKISDNYLSSDFKKEDGYLLSLELSKKYDLYRQNYCGCLYSKKD